MLLFLAAGAVAWALAVILGVPMGWSEGWPFYGLWVVLFPICWLVARTAAFMAALRVAGHMEAAAAAAEAARFGRARRSLFAARMAAFIANAAGAPLNLPRLAHSQTARLLERMGDWEGALKASARLSRCSRRAEDKVVAYNGMLRAMAMLDRREGFAHVFGALEAIFEKESGKYGAQTPAEREKDLSVFQPLAKANYLRGLLAYRSGDLADARHWLRRAATLDPEDLEPLLLMVEIAGWEDDPGAAKPTLRRVWKLAAAPSEKTSKLFLKLREALRAQALARGEKEEDGGEAASPGETEATMERVFSQAADNARWQAAWGELKLLALVRKPGEMEPLIEKYGPIAENHSRGRVEVRLARMLMAALRRQGNAMEAPYAELLHLAKTELVPAELKAEVPLWRAMALIYRGQFQAGLEKFEEIRAEKGSWRAPKLYQVLADAYSAHCLQRLGRPSESVPFRESARQAAAKKSKIAALKLGKKSRLEAQQ